MPRGTSTWAMRSAVIGALLFGVIGEAAAAALTCSTEQQVCITLCNQNPNKPAVPTCIANCRTRQANCRQTGCWDNGINRYCNLTRQ